jgi:hypothetical protein
MKKKRRTSAEPAALYKRGQLSLDAALEQHARNLGLGPVSDGDFLAMQLALGFANLGVTDKPVPLSGGRKLTVAQVIEEFKLEPFLEAQDKQ